MRTAQVRDDGGQSPFLAALFSMMMPGIGQVYNGETKRGLSFMGVVLGALGVNTILAVFASSIRGASPLLRSVFLGLELVCLIVVVCVYLYGIVDAFSRAGRSPRARATSNDARGRRKRKQWTVPDDDSASSSTRKWTLPGDDDPWIGDSERERSDRGDRRNR